MTNKEQILQRLREVKPLLKQKYHITELALFGSYARDEQTEKSDIDIMIDLNDKSFRNYLAAIDILELQFPGIEVQVVSKAAIKPQYFEYVKPDLLYA